MGIEGLRALAALSVLFHHIHSAPLSGINHFGVLSNLLNTAGQGLTLFFVLSGFLLYRPYVDPILSGQRLPSVRRYLHNRALRIMPAYLTIFVLTTYVLQTTYSSGQISPSSADGTPPVGPVTDPWLILANLGVVQTYIPTGIRSGIGPAWSLTVEIVFYLSLPALAFAAAAIVRSRSALLAVVVPPAALLILGFVGNLVAQATLRATDPAGQFHEQWGPTWHSVLERSFLANADLFAYGMIAAVVTSGWTTSRVTDTFLRRVKVGAGLLLLVAPIGLFLLHGSYLQRFADSGFGIAAGALIVLTILPAATGGVSRLARLLEWAPLRWCGLISYSVYLWHVPVIEWWEHHGLGDQTSLGQLVLRAAAGASTTALLAALTYRLVELPALRHKKSARSATPVDAESAAGQQQAAP